MKYLVTGGTGFIGSALVRRLSADGHDVVTFRNDVRDGYEVSQAAAGCDSVIHLAYVQRAAADGYANSAEVLDVAVRGMAEVLNACVRRSIGELMLVSSSLVYNVGGVSAESDPLMVPDTLDLAYAHGGGKIISEMMGAAWQAAAPGRRLIIARPHNVFGPDMGTEHVIPQFCLAMNELDAAVPAPGKIAFPVRGTGEEIRSFCWIGDCVGQLMLLLAKADSPAIYNVGSSDEHTIADVAHAVATCYGREIEVIPGQVTDTAPARRVPDTAKIEALGWDASMEMRFSTGLERTVNWYRRG